MASYILSSAPVPGASANNNNSNSSSNNNMAQAAQAGLYVKETAGDIQRNLTQGDWSLRLLTLLAGFGLMLSSVLGFLGKVFTFRWGSAALDVIFFGVGMAFVILESGRQHSMFDGTHGQIYRTAPPLKYVFGRGAVFIVIGVIQIYMKNLLDFVVGLYVCFVGIMYLWVGRRASEKLARAKRTACTTEELQQHFAMADVDGKGSLTVDQFRQLCNGSLGLNLSRRETEAAFMQIDKSHETGRLTYESVQMWWTEDARNTENCMV